jgi:glycosyltransferase involved in cell wall biosynthesis
MSSPTLSVVMPNYNHARYLRRAIEGILEQTRPADEFLILDDASTDNSVEIIESYAERHSCIRLVKNQRNAGVIAAHEKLFELATGDYLFSAAADDDRYPCFFEQAMEMAVKHPQAGLIFGKMGIIDGAGNEQSVIEPSVWQERLYATPKQFLQEYLEVEPPMHAATGATIFRRQAFAEVGWFPAELDSFADTFAVRAIALKYGACYVPERFSKWRRMSGSYSQKTAQDIRRSIDIVARARRLMQCDEFRDCFPQDYVRRWSYQQKRQVIWTYFLGQDNDCGKERPSFLIRNLRRLPRAATALAALWYQGNPSIDDSSS